MKKGEEIKNIENNNKGELPKDLKIVITAKNVKNPDAVLNNTKLVMKSISKYAFTNNWPSEKDWESILPNWFVNSMLLKTKKDRDNDENLWHFASWIDNVRQRCWMWYSSDVNKNTLTFILEPVSIPYLHDTFIYILYCQGVNIIDIEVVDNIYDER